MNAPQHSYADELNWQPVWLPERAILQDKKLKVRELQHRTVVAYSKRTAAGEQPPLIKVAAITEAGATRYFLVGGWHRMAAGALITRQGTTGPEVQALVAPMSMEEARLQAVHDNRNHGLPLSSKDRALVLKAYIGARRHRIKPRAAGEPEAYRSLSEIAAATGIPKTTVHRWIRKWWPALSLRMGGQEGNKKPEALGDNYDRPPTILDGIRSEYARLEKLHGALPWHEQAEAVKEARRHLRAIGRADYSPPPAVPLEHLQSTDEF